MPNRRTFLKKSFAVSLGSFFFSNTFFDSATFSEIEDFFNGVTLRFPEKTGVLTSAELQMLWNYYKFIGLHWDISAYSSTTKESFTSTLKLKTSVKPSYLYEYRAAINLFKKYKMPDKQIDFKKFLLENTDEFSNKFITLEFINLILVSGGFKKFGYKNYAGYIGGRFDNPTKIPYRV